MSDIAKQRLNYWIMSLIFMLVSCAHPPIQQEQPRPLTQKERDVEMKPGDQTTTLQLNEKCKSVGMNTFSGEYNNKSIYPDASTEYDIRVYSASIGADVAQIIYARHYKSISSSSYDVRFWSCH